MFLYSHADDLQIYLSEDRKDLDEIISALNEDLAAVLLLPYFFYCDVVFSHLSSVDSRRL
jgi:hypothetical protein